MAKKVINESIIRKIVEESIKSYLLESLKTDCGMDEEKKMIDNFDRAEKFMEFNSPDDFYFVQIVKRLKDNPNDDRRQGNYHAGAWYFEKWRIHSAQELEQLKPQIIASCEKNNARAYISLNSRSDKMTDAQIIKVRRMYPRGDARNVNADAIVPAQPKYGPNWKGQRLKFFIDIDSTDTKIWDECKKIIAMCGMKPIDEYTTANGGLHILMPNKEDPNIDYLLHMLHKLDNWVDKGRLAMAHPNFDGRIILYSNVDAKGYK